MIKKYISILELLPTLINDDDKSSERHRGFFPTNERTDGTYYYEIVAASTPNNQKLHFKNIQQVLANKLAEFEDEFNLERSGRQVNNDDYKAKPFILNRSYVVPHILEFEYLKNSVYGEIMKDEHLDYIENILYQYLLYYNRTTQSPDASLMTHYEDTSETGELYWSLSEYIIEKDNEDDDFDTFVNETIIENYNKLSKMKKMTKPKASIALRRMYACRNLEELIEIAPYRTTMYDYSKTPVSRIEDMTRSIPLLMLYSVIEQEIGTDIMPSYRNYNEVFENYLRDLKGPIREDYTKEEYIEDNNLYIYNRQINEDQVPSPLINIYASQLQYGTSYIEYDNGRMNQFLFPHILNQIRNAYFRGSDKMVVPQSLSGSFIREPWANLVEPETILSIRNLEWGE